MKKGNLVTLIALIVSIVAIVFAVRVTNERNSAIIQYEEMKELYNSTNEESLKYKMNPDRLKQLAYDALKKEDDDAIKEAIKLLEKYHLETPQCAEARGYLKTLKNKREQKRIAEEKAKEAARLAEERKFKFNICGIYLGMSEQEYNSLISKYKSSGKLHLYTETLYCMFWFRTAEEVEVKSYGARSARKDTFKMNADYDVILKDKPVFTNGKLSKMTFLISPSFEDAAIVSYKKNIDLISEYLDLTFDSNAICKNDWLYWSKNNQIVSLYNETQMDYWDGLTYYRLIMSR